MPNGCDVPPDSTIRPVKQETCAASALSQAPEESMSSAASSLSPGQIAGRASGCRAHHCSICCTFFVRALNPVGTSGALSSPQGKTGHPVWTRLRATSRIGCPISPSVLASTSPCSARVSIRPPDVDQLVVVVDVSLLFELRECLFL